MLKFKSGLLEKIQETDLKIKGILERKDFQKAIIESWDAFRSEINMSDLLYIGEEVFPHRDVNDRIDILAYDPQENVPVIIELKRSRDKFQLLQGLSYASMLSNRDSDFLIETAKNQKSPYLDDLVSAIEEKNIGEIKIILVAEKFDPEVIITCDWLVSKYELDIKAMKLFVFEHQKEIFFDFQCIYPLTSLEESYSLRGQTRKSSQIEGEETSWEDVKQRLSYAWGALLIDKLLSLKLPSLPKHRRFYGLGRQLQEISFVNVNFRNRDVNVTVYCDSSVDESYFKEKIQGDFRVRSWKRGYAFNLSDKSQVYAMFKWLGVTLSN